MPLTSQRIHLRDVNQFPTTQLFLLALVRVAEPIAITSILPYAWNLVLRFNVGDERSASFYAGLLVSAFSFTESLTGMLWGSLSDRIGRKPVLIMGCLGTVASLLVVGFSTSFWMALFGRALGGALNGNIGVIQTMVGELVVNPKHEPKAYAIMPFVWSVGTIAGPACGGFFASPADSFPRYFSKTGIFGQFPYLLPNLICAGLMLLSIGMGFLFLDETHPDKQPWSINRETYVEPPHLVTQASATTAQADLTHESYGTFNHVCKDTAEDESKVEYELPGSKISIFQKRIVMLIVALGIFTYHSMTYDHLLPIFFQDKRTGPSISAASTPSINMSDAFAGGLGYTVQDVGVIMSLNGLIALGVQAIVFPLVVGAIGVWKTFLVVTILHPIAYFVVPFLVALPPAWLTTGVYACLTLRNLLSILAYPVLLILIKEASPAPSCLGRINGLAASTGAGCRTIASPLAGLLYGIGKGAGFTPLAYWASAAIAVGGAVQALLIGQAKEGVHHHIRSALAGCPGEDKSITSVRVTVSGGDSGYSSDDETTPLVRRGQ